MSATAPPPLLPMAQADAVAVGDDDEDEFCAPVVRAWVKAAEVPRPQGLGPSSIFSMADAAASAKALRQHGRFGDAAGFKTQEPGLTVVRTAGVVKVCGARYPANRWDDEREEKERQRRARQKPPKPTKGAKSRGRKVRAWDGEFQE